MKVKFSTEELKHRLAELGAVVAKKAAQPVYGYVRIVTGPEPVDGKLPVFITGLDIDASLTIQFLNAEADGDFDILLQFSKLTEIMGNVTVAETIIEAKDETKAALKAGKYKADLRPHPLTEFPAIPERPEEAKATVPLALFKELLGNVEFAIPNSDGKHVVAVAKVEAVAKTEAAGDKPEVPGSLRAIATDGHRLVINSANGDFGAFELVLPKPAIDLIRKLDGGETLTVLEAESGFQFETAVETLTVSRSHGTFPDYSRIFPKSVGAELTVDKSVLLAAVKRVKPLGDGEKPTVIFSVEENGTALSLSTKALVTDGGGINFESAASDEVDVVSKGFKAEFVLNANYLTDWLEKAYGSKTGAVTIRLKDASKSIVDMYASEGLYRYLVAPTAA